MTRVLELAVGKDITTVILAANWTIYAEGTRFSAEGAAPSIVLKDGASYGTDRRQNPSVFSRGLERTVAALAGAQKRIIIVASVPEIKFSVPEVLARKHMFNVDIDIRPTLSSYLQRQEHVFPVLERMHELYGAKIIYPHAVLCTSGHCEVMSDGRPYYSDSNHLTEIGAKLLSPLFEKIVQSAPAK